MRLHIEWPPSFPTEWPLAAEVQSPTQLQEDEGEPRAAGGPEQRDQIRSRERLCQRQGRESLRSSVHLLLAAEPRNTGAVPAPAAPTAPG